MKLLNTFALVLLLSLIDIQSIRANGIDYDVIYVNYPATNPDGSFVTIPQGEQPYPISWGADLMLLKSNGQKVTLVDCTSCSVMDPYISYDGRWVYYSLIENTKPSASSWLYKLNLFDSSSVPIRLTFDDGFDSSLYAANKTAQHDQKSYRLIRDMSPIPLASGKLLFTSNRAGLTAINAGTNEVRRGSVQQLYIMDDHDGSKKTKFTANIERLETGSLHAVQHPIQLLDGRILFSTWQDVATKYHYAMTPLFTVNPDGTNLKQFTEPHEHHKMVEHFITQLSDESVVSGLYYPSFDYGYGLLMRYPLLSNKVKYIRGSVKQKYSNGKRGQISFREFDRIGTHSITPHTTPNDVPAPNLSGKYSMPAAAPGNNLLVAYSKGSVNHFGAACKKQDACEHLKSGIYLIKNPRDNQINHPNQLIKVVDDPLYNEIWPRAVVPYIRMFGVDKPNQYVNKVVDTRIAKGSATAIVGTSSMYNRESQGSEDPHQAKSGNRELHDGNWTIQGSDAGVYRNSDIYAVRIIGTPAKPFTKPISKYAEKDRWQSISKHLGNAKLDRVVSRYASYLHERWEILGEFPLNYKSVLDDQGNPDSSWAAKIPAETPFLIQTLDKNGMTLNSELTWRALKPGEVRTDCGGCHAHSIEPLDFKTTFAGMRVPITGVPGTKVNSPGLKDGLWDLTTGKIPVLSGDGIEYLEQNVLGVEFRRDVEPVLNKRCGECHTANGTAQSLVLDGSDGKDVWDNISDTRRPDGKKYVVPQRSKYIRVPQARQSLLVWVAYGERLDGRQNSTRDNDVDYPDSHPYFYISEKEKRTIARWVDLGGPINFPQTDGMGYTDDNQLPVVNMEVEHDGKWGRVIRVGVFDVHTDINWTSLKLRVELIGKSDGGWLNSVLSSNADNKLEMEPSDANYREGVVTYYLSDQKLEGVASIMITAEVLDMVGNKNIAKKHITLK